MNTEYLLFNLIVIGLPSLSVLLRSLTKMKLPHFYAAIKAIACVSIPYLIWDFFVADKWWYFNELYVTGLQIGTLPIEEVLFFVTVPWSCLVIWVNLPVKFTAQLSIKIEPIWMLFGVLIAINAAFQAWWYTLTIGILLIAFGVFSTLHNFWLSNIKNLLFLGVISLLTILFNGYLTARPVVTYNYAIFSNLRVSTVPLEDIGYGIILIGTIAILYDQFSQNKSR